MWTPTTTVALLVSGSSEKQLGRGPRSVDVTVVAQSFRPIPTQASMELVPVLAISHGAAEAIRLIVSSSHLSEGGGIRISAEPIDEATARIELSLADTPGDDDSVVEEQGASVFVEAKAATFLNDKILDATVEDDSVSFSIAEQQQDWTQNGQPKSIDPRRFT